MDRIAIISDIHGNMPALEAVLDDIRDRGIDRIFCLGDLVGKGPHPDRAVDITHEVCAVTVKGNWDDYILRPAANPTIEWHRQRLGAERLDYLRGLPDTFEFHISGKRVRLFHSSQVGIYHRVHMRDTPERHAAMFENTEFTGFTPRPDVVGYGDIHDAYINSFDHKILFNAGSVGNPLDMTLAAYAVLEGGYDSETLAVFGLQLVRVPYDIERAIREAEQEAMPDLQAYANELRTAQYRGLAVAT